VSRPPTDRRTKARGGSSSEAAYGGDSSPRGGADLRPDSLVYEVFVLGQAVKRLLDGAMADGPLRPEDYAVYSVVFEAESVTPTAMAASLAMPLTTVMDWIGLMERRGHARRRPHPSDGRATLVTLTARGLRVHREANLRFERAYRLLLETLPSDERRLREALVALREATLRAAVRLGGG
jgi:DNA-binding MarR family transcriptional regulator